MILVNYVRFVITSTYRTWIERTEGTDRTGKTKLTFKLDIPCNLMCRALSTLVSECLMIHHSNHSERSTRQSPWSRLTKGLCKLLEQGASGFKRNFGAFFETMMHLRGAFLAQRRTSYDLHLLRGAPIQNVIEKVWSSLENCFQIWLKSFLRQLLS